MTTGQNPDPTTANENLCAFLILTKSLHLNIQSHFLFFFFLSLNYSIFYQVTLSCLCIFGLKPRQRDSNKIKKKKKRWTFKHGIYKYMYTSLNGGGKVSHSLQLKRRVTQTLLGSPSSWCSTLSSHLHCSPVTQTEGWGSTALWEKDILPASLMKSRDWEQSTHLLNFRVDVQKNHQFSDLFSTLCQ